MKKCTITSILIRSKSNSLQPRIFNKEDKEKRAEIVATCNDYTSIQIAASPQNKLNKCCHKRTITTNVPTLFGVEKQQAFNNKNDEKQSRIMKISNANHTSIKHPPQLDNISINSPEGNNGCRANTTKYNYSRRIKSNESKQSQGFSKKENTNKTHDLAQFFERRINFNDQFRK